MSNLDEYYTYDALSRLNQMQRGTLNSTKTGIVGTPALEQDWTLDPTGNWNGYQNQTSGTTSLSQTRSHNKVNAITGITSTPFWPTPPGYDAAGNTRFFPSAQNPEAAMSGVYDAWNRPGGGIAPY